jgi:hypothetical protein
MNITYYKRINNTLRQLLLNDLRNNIMYLSDIMIIYYRINAVIAMLLL